MARHARSVNQRARATRLWTVGVVWIAGLAVAFFGILGAAARYGCATTNRGLACRTSGSVLGVLIVLIVFVVVSTVSVLTHDRPPRRVLRVGAFGVGMLVVCFAAAWMLLDTA